MSKNIVSLNWISSSKSTGISIEFQGIFRTVLKEKSSSRRTSTRENEAGQNDFQRLIKNSSCSSPVTVDSGVYGPFWKKKKIFNFTGACYLPGVKIKASKEKYKHKN